MFALLLLFVDGVLSRGFFGTVRARERVKKSACPAIEGRPCLSGLFLVGLMGALQDAFHCHTASFDSYVFGIALMYFLPFVFEVKVSKKYLHA